MKGKAIVTVLLLLGTVIGVFSPIAGSEGDTEISVWVMVDFGNGEVEWAEVDLSDNHTGIKATEDACEKLGLSITVSWSQWGAFVSEIGGVTPPDWSWWWGIFIWNHSQNNWESSSYGASSIELDDGDIMGWAPTWDFVEPVKPIATPSMKYPWTMFRNNAFNSGSTKNVGPETNSVSWIFDTQTKELPASPAVADEKVVINNWGGVFCLNLKGEMIWKNEDVLGGFSPAIAYNSVFVGGNDGFLYSLNLTSGKTRWSAKITDHPGISGVTSAPAIDKGRVYVGSFNFSGGPGSLFCLDEKSGSIIWETPTSSSVYFSSPAVADDKVFVGTMGLYNSSNLQWKAPYEMFCFSNKNGELIWNFSVGGSVGATPSIVNEKLLFTSKDGYLYCLELDIGELIWKKEIGSSVSSAAISQDKIYVGSGEMNNEGMFYCLNLNGNILWEFEPNGAVQSSPAVAGDFVYFATNVKEGTIYCINRENGDLKWQYKPTPEEYIISSPIVVGGKMYIASDNGRLYCFDGDSPKFTVNQTTDSQMVHLGEDVIFLHKNKENRLTITAFFENSVTLQIDSMDNPLEVSKGRTTTVDTDSDGERDLAISIGQVNATSQTVSLSLDLFTEPPDEDDERVPLVMLIALLIVVVLIIVGIGINLKRKPKKP